MTSPLDLRIGLSSCFSHADEPRDIFKGRTLLFVEQSMAHYVMSAGLLPVLVPTAGGTLGVEDLVGSIDGLLLTGGSDVSPRSYGEEPLQSRWAGDYVRDQYEITLTTACMERDIPVLGVCRGAQILNVALGGTLYQDITAQVPGAIVHRDASVYNHLYHDVAIAPDSGLAALYPGQRRATINSVHHQGIKDVAPGLTVEARCVDDDIIEALRYTGDRTRYMFGVQWHPEFTEPEETHLLPAEPLLHEFLDAVRARAPRARR